MKEKKAFIILPYRPQFKRVYSMIIKPAVEEMGYTCIPLGQQGHIMRAVVQNLAESDLVIADLTELNWNVAYELGIRHTMYRNGTILMFSGDENDQNKFLSEHFDIQHFEILRYPSDWLDNAGEEQVIEMLKRRIDDIEQNRNPNGDSPVHDVYNNLPPTFTALLSENESASQKSAARIRELEHENAKLRKRLDSAGLSENAKERSGDLRELFREALHNGVYYSDDAVRRLRELKKENKLEEFADFLTMVLQKGYLDEYDCRDVYNLCLGINTPLTKIYLEEVVRLYPDNEEMAGFLARELCKSNETRDQALALVNDMIGVTRKNGKFELTGNKHVVFNTLNSFFMVYQGLHKQNELIQIAPLLLQQYQKTSMQSLILRYTISAHLNIDQPQEALKVSQQLLELAPSDDMSYDWRSRALRAADDPVGAMEALENCIRIDSNYFNYYSTIAGLICDERIARTELSELPQAIPEKDREKYAVPFLIYGFCRRPDGHQQKTVDFLLRNGFDSAHRRLYELLINKTPMEDILEAFSDYDFSYVHFCLEKEI